jgi:hypothetical protein
MNKVDELIESMSDELAGSISDKMRETYNNSLKHINQNSVGGEGEGDSNLNEGEGETRSHLMAQIKQKDRKLVIKHFGSINEFGTKKEVYLKLLGLIKKLEYEDIEDMANELESLKAITREQAEQAKDKAEEGGPSDEEMEEMMKEIPKLKRKFTRKMIGKTIKKGLFGEGIKPSTTFREYLEMNEAEFNKGKWDTAPAVGSNFAGAVSYLKSRYSSTLDNINGKSDGTPDVVFDKTGQQFIITFEVAGKDPVTGKVLKPGSKLKIPIATAMKMATKARGK